MPRLLSFVSALLMLAGMLAAPAAADDRSVCFNANIAPDTAIEACGRMISSRRVGGRDLGIIYTNRARAYNRKGDYDRAIADWTEAIRLDPKYAIAYNGRAVAYNRKGDYNRAIADL